jgi:hypothetical protein
MANDNAKRVAPELKVNRFPANYPREFMESPDTLWLKITPRGFRPNINLQTGINSSPTSDVALYFLLQKNFSFGVDHTWNDLTTVAGAFRDVKAGIQKAGAGLGALGVPTDIIGLGDFYAGGKTVKNDNPYIYETSSRRKIQLEFQFGTYDNAEQDVWNPIQSLIIWSCAEKANGSTNTSVTMPYVFQLQTITGAGDPVDLIKMEHACIDQITPTFHEPYKNGYPMKATCSVNFTSINPTYRSEVSTNGKPRISAGIDTNQGQPKDASKLGDLLPTSSFGAGFTPTNSPQDE